MKTKLKISILILLAAVASFAQTTLTSTTLAAAMVTTSGTPATVLSITSATGITGQTLGGFTTYLWIDQELMGVSTVSGTRITVVRGQAGTQPRNHNNAAVVWLGSSAAFLRAGPNDPSGQCQRTLLAYVPRINPGTGNMFDCLGVTTAGQWVQVNAPGVPVVGSTVASATSITPTGTYFVVSGTTAIATIAVPAGWGPGMCLAIQPSGVFATTTADNIGLVSSASVVGRILTMCWSGAKWYPSYVS